MPLADQAGRVALVAQELRKRLPGRRQPQIGVSRFRMSERTLEREALLVASADQSGARRRAARSIRIELGEAHARFREAVDVGRLDVGSAVAAEISISHIVRDDQDDVRTRSGSRLRTKRCDRDGADRSEQNWSTHSALRQKSLEKKAET